MRREKKRGRGAKRDEGGFTMIEIIVVIAILSVLASIAVPLVTVMEDRAREEATESEMKNLEQALVDWYEDHDSFPADLDSLPAGGYLTADVDPTGHARDAWFNDYVYTPAGMAATLTSGGADLTPATADDLTLNVSAGIHARTVTRDELATIHVALRHYESLRIPNSWPALPAHWEDQGVTPGGFSELVSRGLLPNETRLLTDAWGSIYAFPGTPADYATSPNLGGGP